MSVGLSGGRSLYAYAWSAVRSRWGLGVATLVGSGMHAAGHAFLAAGAGGLVQVLAGHAPVDAGSTMMMFRSPGEASPPTAVLSLAIGGVFAALSKLVGGALASWSEARLSGDVGATVRLAVLDDVLARDGAYVPRHGDHGPVARAHDGGAELAPRGPRGDRLAALTIRIHDVERGVAHGVLAELRAIVALVPLGALLIALAPRLAGSAVVALGGFGVFAFSLRRAFKRAHARASASAGALVEAADEAVRHADLWATYGAKRRIRSHVTEIGRALAREGARIRVRASLLSSTSEVLGAIALMLVLFLVSRNALEVDRGTVLPFAIAFFMTYRPLRDLVDARLARARGEAALESAFRPMDLACEPAQTSRNSSGVGVIERRARRGDRARPTEGDREPSDASSRWSLEPLVLENVRALHGDHGALSVEVPAGAVAAIVGPTGIGKTSLLRGLLGLEPLRAGTLRYGGRALTQAGVGPSERPFAWVPQDAPVIGDTLAMNVGLGRGDDDGLTPDPWPILAELGATHLAKSLGDEVLGTRRPLSGGERQWIAVARALATGLPVLLLDEPTSALDPASQVRLLEAIARLRGKRTILVVTHRPEPLAVADIVVRLGARVRVDADDDAAVASWTRPTRLRA